MKTTLTIQEDKFLINGQYTYSEIKDTRCAGFLMNARFIQGVFDDASGRERYQRFGRVFDPEKNTDDLIQALPEWYACGLRAITVGFQGGGPAFTINNQTIINNPYRNHGTEIDPAYLARMDRLITACDELGMVVIVSLLYGAQTRFLADDQEIENAVVTACTWLKEQGYTNVIIEIANENDVYDFKDRPIIHQDYGVVHLMEKAREASGHMPVGCSGTGGYFSEAVARNSDVILIHGNSQSRTQLYHLIQKAKKIRPLRPIVINEDSPSIGAMRIAMSNGVSWGYYNNFTKQEPPADWHILPGEDEYFALRMKEELGIGKIDPTQVDHFRLCGLEKDLVYENKRFIRLAALYPEQIDYVEFYRSGELYDTAYDEVYMVHAVVNYYQLPVMNVQDGEIWRAVIHLGDCSTVTCEAVAGE
ncbi:MAG: hypothetical protein IKE36_00085 [Solobacterium sp.]|nr:hypothetical protein [Solobacterium sp.]